MADIGIFDVWVVTEFDDSNRFMPHGIIKKDLGFFVSRIDAISYSKRLSCKTSIELKQAILNKRTGETKLVGAAFKLSGELGG